MAKETEVDKVKRERAEKQAKADEAAQKVVEEAEAKQAEAKGKKKKKTLKERWSGLSKGKKIGIGVGTGLLGVAGVAAYRDPLSKKDEKKEKK